ncbi:MAG: radical SAM family heme chaperone HemW [Bacteroidia bacterium]|nr:MAG: radical SAM family heme chaperone HemW [Bacteroidia bacterium]
MAGIYIHIPFCRQACHYCNFHFSVSLKNKLAFIDALLIEAEMRQDFFHGLPSPGCSTNIETIYIGGGTPSLLHTSELTRIIERIRKLFPAEQVKEITLEANPDDLTYEKLLSLWQSPINRLSIGVQSFHFPDLQFMNRGHSPVQALQSIRNAQKIGFTDLTIDLIYGIPGLSDPMWEANLRQLIDLEIPHISAYALTVEKKTVLEYMIRKGKASAVSDEQAARQFNIMCDMLEQSGYAHYEISNFALPGFQSRHNMSYWTGVPYLGMGPSAHSFKPGKRYWNPANTSQYIEAMQKGKFFWEGEELTEEDACNEYVMTSLRTSGGCDLQKVYDEWGKEVADTLSRRAEKHIRHGKILRKGQMLTLTRDGKFFADGIAADLFIVSDR